MNNFFSNLMSNFFGGWLGIQIVIFFAEIFSGNFYASGEKGGGYSHFFISLLWLPIGFVLSAIASVLNFRIQIPASHVFLAAVIAGAVSLLSLAVFANFDNWMFFWAPLVAFVAATYATPRLICAVFGKKRNEKE